MTWAGRTASKATRRPRNNQVAEESREGEEGRNARERKRIVSPYYKPLQLYRWRLVVAIFVDDSTVTHTEENVSYA
eukprot:3130769-Rhodomonas_salina.1